MEALVYSFMVLMGHEELRARTICVCFVFLRVILTNAFKEIESSIFILDSIIF